MIFFLSFASFSHSLSPHWLTESKSEMDALFRVIDEAISFAYSFSDVANSTVVLVPSSLSFHMEKIASAIDMDVETTSMVLGLFMCYPCGMVMAALPYGRLKHLFSFLLGAFLLQFVLGKQWIHQVSPRASATLIIVIVVTLHSANTYQTMCV